MRQFAQSAICLTRRIEPLIITPADFDRALRSLYRRARDEPEDEEVRVVAISNADGNELDVQRLRDIANEAPVVRLVNQIISSAVEQGASDIHIEPRPDAIAVRCRIDGFLQQDRLIPPSLRAALVTRIKIMAKLDIAERRLPQDGRIKTAVRGVEIDIRVSTLPTAFGEGIVLRILDRTRVELDLSKLGLSGATQAGLQRLLPLPNGIVLVTGPTGSGKTTTLYAALQELNRPELKLFSVEDPIEYQLTGVNQIQVQPQIGLTFPVALRSILRQDPDIVMIGEIRDLETAQIAVQAALTGHLVFSTLHTNSALGAITRLVDSGAEALPVVFDNFGGDGATAGPQALSGLLPATRGPCGSRQRNWRPNCRLSISAEEMQHSGAGWLRILQRNRLSRSHNNQRTGHR